MSIYYKKNLIFKGSTNNDNNNDNDNNNNNNNNDNKNKSTFHLNEGVQDKASWRILAQQGRGHFE